MTDTPSHVFIDSPNKPRPADGSRARELADMLAAVERNYGREGSGPGSRFEGRLLEDVQAEAVLRRIAERQRFVLVWRDERAAEICRSAPVALGTARIAIPLDAQHADLTGGDSG